MAQKAKTPPTNKAKRNLWLNVFIGIALCLSISAYLFRTNLFKELVGVHVPFQVDEPPIAPDYNDSSAWVKRPQGNTIGHPAVFYVHPTTYYNSDFGWNDEITDSKSNEILEKIAIPNHAMPFNIGGNLWIPRYRQATLFSTLAYNDDTRGALDLAYKDIETAFLNFQAAIGENTPFVLAGMNQGGLHLVRLLQTQITNKPIEKRVIAVYLIDQTIAQDEFTKQNFGNLEICNNPTKTNCIISYQAIDNNNQRNIELFKNRTPLYSTSRNYHMLANQPNICTNPLNGGERESADASQNKGSAAANNLESGIEPAFLPLETGASCKNGVLLVDHDRSQSLKAPFFELGTLYKVPNYNLFYQALREDCQNRINSFQKQNINPNTKN